MNLVDNLNLDLAWARVKNDSKTDFILSSYLSRPMSGISKKILKNFKKK